jgi:hypothetical protein
MVDPSTSSYITNMTRAWKEVFVLMEAASQDSVGIEESLLHPIAMMDIYVQIKYPFKGL